MTASEELGLCVDIAVCADKELMVTVFDHHLRLQILGDHKFPLKAASAGKVENM